MTAFAGSAAAHTCHADGCEVHVSPARLMCPMHWRMVTKSLRGQVWAAYAPGQEHGPGPGAPRRSSAGG